jgi:hypothetical protein
VGQRSAGDGGGRRRSLQHARPRDPPVAALPSRSTGDARGDGTQERRWRWIGRASAAVGGTRDGRRGVGAGRRGRIRTSNFELVNN